MLDSQRTFKIKIMLHWTVFKILHLKSFAWELVCLILQNYKRHEFHQDHSKKLL